MTPPPKEVKKPPVVAGKKRFAEPLNVEELKTIEEAQVPKRMKQATHWALRAFDEWVTSRNTIACNMFSCPDLLKNLYSPAVLDQWLAAFIMEVRKADGTHYSPDSLQCLVAGLQRYLRENLGRAAPNIVDKRNNLFPKKRNALDRQLKYLRSIGVGVVKKRAPVITHEAENMLWEKKIIGVDTPQSLLNAVFLNGKNFVLRGVKEQLNLRFGQITLLANPERIHYVEHGSKNNAGGIAEQNLTVKNVTINSAPDSARCHVRIYCEYLKRVPPETIRSNERFYLQPV